MDLNTFSIDELPFQTTEALPKDCTKHEIKLGFTPNEKDETNPNMFMDEMFAVAAGGGVKPAPTKKTELYYYGQYYDIEAVMEYMINYFHQQGIDCEYKGPKILENKLVEDRDGDGKYVIVFDGELKYLGIDGIAGNSNQNAQAQSQLVSQDDGQESNNQPVINGIYPFFVNAGVIGNESNVWRIDIPEGVETIGAVSITNLPSLEVLTIPSTVKGIDERAISDCRNLTNVTCLPTVPPTLGDGNFNGTGDGLSIKVPRESYDIYIEAEGWSKFADHISEIPDSDGGR